MAGIIATAVGQDLLIAHPHDALHSVGLAMVLGGPALFLLAESVFRWRITRVWNRERLAASALLILLAPLAVDLSALLLSAIATGVLVVLVASQALAAARLAHDAVRQ